MGTAETPRPRSPPERTTLWDSGRGGGRRRRIFQLVALGFAIAALWHLLALVIPLDASSPAWRHASFVAINALLVAGMVRRPRWFCGLFALVTAQQFWSHGRSLLTNARAGTLDVPSLVVLTALPLVLVLLLRDAFGARQE